MNILQRIVLGGVPEDARAARAEFRAALAIWACLCQLVFAVVIARVAGASLFLSRYDGRELALVYVAVGFAVVAILYGLSWVTHGVRYDRVATCAIVSLAIGAATFRTLMDRSPGDHSVLYGVLHVFLETLVLVTTMQVWSLANSLFTAAQARRLYIFIATGGIVGSVLGGVATQMFAFLRTEDLLWVVVAACPGMIVAIVAFRRQAQHLAPLIMKQAMPAGWSLLASADRSNETVRWIRHPVLRQRPVLKLASRLSLLAFLTAFTTNLIDFFFKIYADHEFHGDTAQLTRFFGNFYLMVGCTAMAMQLVVTPVIVRQASMFVGLTLTPVVLSLGTLINLFHGTLFRATLLKLFDSGFAHSVQRSCTEMLYTPLPSHLTGEIKLLSEGVAGRAGLVGSGILLWALAPLLNPERTLLLVSALLITWFATLVLLKESYRSVTGAADEPICEPESRAA